MRPLSAWIRSSRAKRRSARACTPRPYPALSLRRLEERRVLNGEPVANPDAYGVAEDGVLSVSDPGVLGNDTGTGTLTAVKVSDPAHGVLTLNPDGSFEYTPDADFFGTDSFTYLVNDGSLDSLAPATVTITVSEVNDPPTAVDDAVATAEDTPVDIAAADLVSNDSPGPANEAGQTLTVNSVSPTSAAGGTVVLNAGVITYTPPAGFSGADSFTYTISDDGTTDGAADPQQATGTVTIEVSEVNDPPTAVDDELSTAEDAPLSFAASDLLANDSPGPAEEAGQNLAVVAVSGTSAQGGTVTLVAGQITYTPPPDFFGIDSFTYTIEDDGTTGGAPDPQQATGTVTVVVTSVNDPPVAEDDPLTTAEDTPLEFSADDLLANDQPGPANESGQTLTITGVSPTSAAGGTVTFDNGQITYTPPPNFNGTDWFTYTVTDDGATDGAPDPRSSQGTVSITVTAVNDPPTVVDDTYTIHEDGSLVVDAAGGLLANDFDVDADPAVNQAPGAINDLDPATLQIVSGPSHGTAVLAPDGSFVYTPDPGFGGQSDSFVYSIADTAGAVSFGTVTIDVLAVADAPTLAAAGLPATSVTEGSTIQFTLSGELNDPDGSEVLSFEVNNVPEGWILTSPDATVARNGNDYVLTPQPGASTVTVVLFAPDDGDQSVEIRAVATETGALIAVAEARTVVVHTFTATNVAPTIAVSDGDVNSLGFVSVTVTVFDPGADDLSFQIDWGDGTIYHSGTIPGVVGGQTYTTVVTHQYFFTPASAVATGEIVIQGVAVDDDGGLRGDVGVLSVPARIISATRIDTAPVAPPPLPPPRAVLDAGLGDRSIPAVNTRPAETGSPRSETRQTGQPTLSLRVVSPAGEEGEDIDLPLTTLGDLRSFFRRLPDGHYRLYLTERGGSQRRLVLDVFVRRGQPADPEEVRPRDEFLDPPQPSEDLVPADDRAALLDRLWERRGASEDRPLPFLPGRTAEVDAAMERLAVASGTASRAGGAMRAATR